MKDYLLTTGEMALEEARKKGVEAEAFLMYDRVLSLEVANGQVETLKEAEEIGLGLRIIDQGRVGFTYTSDLSKPAVAQALDEAVKIAAYTGSDRHNMLPKHDCSYQSMDIFDPLIETAGLEAKIDLARQVESSAKAFDSRITVVEKAAYEDVCYLTVVLNTCGVSAWAQGNYCGLYTAVIAEENGEAQSGFALMTKRKYKDLDQEIIGQEAAEEAVRSLGARSIISGNMPCVLSPYVTTRFLGLIAAMVNAEAVQKGKSMLAGKVGTVVGSPLLNLVDDAIYPGGIATFPFDGEGVPAQKKVILNQGLLQGYLHDTYTASRDGVKSTGNGCRASFRGLPAVGITNFILFPGDIGPGLLIAGVEKGLYVTEVMGMHTANPISGDFSVGAGGIMIEHGKLAYPVRGVTIAGNMAGFLKNIDGVADDLRFFGSRGAPSIRLQGLSISGD